MTRRRTRRLGPLLAAVLVLFAMCAPGASAADSHQQIEGSGSSWATNALNIWISNVTSAGLKVVFTSIGSAQGRKDFGNQTTDFAVSDIGYQVKDPQTGDPDLPCKLNASNQCRAYAYLPIVAGGTSFPYHIEVGGKLVTNLRLSGETLAKIFTGQITNWNDKEITADNNGHALPSLNIIPVNHAEGSGSSAQFTTYLDDMYPSIWRPYNNGRAGETEYFPPSKNAIQQTGSDGVINFITSSAANGAIGYDEYSYALAKSYPVVKLENAAGYYTLPTQFNVAVALQKAKINTDKSSPNYLLQNLHDVYRYNDPRTYPLSSYSYMIIPTSASDSRLDSTAKRQTLADFIYYSVCDGQGQVGPIGYSSLPLNLVQASFDQTALLKKADPKVDLTNRNVTSCNNPTFVPGNLKANHLAQIAPAPPACDKSGAGPCTGAGDPGTVVVVKQPGGASGGGKPTGIAGGGATPTNGATGPGGRGGTPNGSGRPGGTTPTAGATPGATGGASAAPVVAGGSSASTHVDPETGQIVTDGAQNVASGGDATAVTTDLASYRQKNMTMPLSFVVALEILLLLALPPVVYYSVLRRRRRAS